VSTSVGGDPSQGIADRAARAGCVGYRSREESSREVVLARWEADRQVALGAPVQLRRSSRAWPLTATESTELGGEQPVGDEAIEVERGDGPGHAERGGGLVLAHGRIPRDHELIQGPTLWLGQGRDTGDAVLEIVRSHRRPLSKCYRT
jgi:hypothetical protein